MREADAKTAERDLWSAPLRWAHVHDIPTFVKDWFRHSKVNREGFTDEKRTWTLQKPALLK
jgi:hypothetical protein